MWCYILDCTSSLFTLLAISSISLMTKCLLRLDVSPLGVISHITLYQYFAGYHFAIRFITHMTFFTFSLCLQSEKVMIWKNWWSLFSRRVKEMPAITLPSFCLQNEKSEQMNNWKSEKSNMKDTLLSITLPAKWTSEWRN